MHPLFAINLPHGIEWLYILIAVVVLIIAPLASLIVIAVNTSRIAKQNSRPD